MREKKRKGDHSVVTIHYIKDLLKVHSITIRDLFSSSGMKINIAMCEI